MMHDWVNALLWIGVWSILKLGMIGKHGVLGGYAILEGFEVEMHHKSRHEKIEIERWE